MKRNVAIVGSRETNDYWKKQAYRFSYDLAKSGITIVSGLARGIDTVAHRAALDARGRTIAILGSGKDIIYPPENKDLAERIKKHGKVISPFPDGTLPLGKNFLARNKIIAEISLAVLVIGGKRRSGTLSTAASAANLGKEVFVVPGPNNDLYSEVGYYLIENGATVVTSPSEIIDYITNLSL